MSDRASQVSIWRADVADLGLPEWTITHAHHDEASPCGTPDRYTSPPPVMSDTVDPDSRPFSCPHCKKQWDRRDLRERHRRRCARKHLALGPAAAAGRKTSCKACVASKLRCSRQGDACERCISRHIPCIWPVGLASGHGDAGPVYNDNAADLAKSASPHNIPPVAGNDLQSCNIEGWQPSPFDHLADTSSVFARELLPRTSAIEAAHSYRFGLPTATSSTSIEDCAAESATLLEWLRNDPALYDTIQSSSRPPQDTGDSSAAARTSMDATALLPLSLLQEVDLGRVRLTCLKSMVSSFVSSLVGDVPDHGAEHLRDDTAAPLSHPFVHSPTRFASGSASSHNPLTPPAILCARKVSRMVLEARTAEERHIAFDFVDVAKERLLEHDIFGLGETEILAKLQALLILQATCLLHGDEQQLARLRVYHEIVFRWLRGLVEGGIGRSTQSDSEGTDPCVIWKAWTVTESMRRTVFAAVLFDVLFAAITNTRPMTCQQVLEIPLPSSSETWTAKSAEEWHRRMRFERQLSGDALKDTLATHPGHLSTLSPALDTTMTMMQMQELKCILAQTPSLKQLSAVPSAKLAGQLDAFGTQLILTVSELQFH